MKLYNVTPTKKKFEWGETNIMMDEAYYMRLEGGAQNDEKMIRNADALFVAAVALKRDEEREKEDE